MQNYNFLIFTEYGVEQVGSRHCRCNAGTRFVYLFGMHGTDHKYFMHVSNIQKYEKMNKLEQ